MDLNYTSLPFWARRLWITNHTSGRTYATIRLIERAHLSAQLSAVDNAFESGILSMQQRTQSGRLKLFASLSKYQERTKARSPR